jgi:O-antigen/teichoic acid export membrane protein
VLAGALTVYLARRLGPASYGLYVLALAIGAAALYVGWMALPLLWQRLTGHDDSSDPERRAPRTGLGLRVSCTAVLAVAVFLFAGPIADSYGRPALTWPLRWVAVAVAGQGVVWFVAARGLVTRASAFGGSVVAAQQLAQAVDMIALVSYGAGPAGALLARISGYVVAGTGLFLFAPGHDIPPPDPEAAEGDQRRVCDPNAIADADATWLTAVGLSAIVVAAVVAAAPLGRFGAAVSLAAVLGYAGHELAGGPAAWRYIVAGRIDAARVARGLRFLVRSQGAMVAPLVVWAEPLMQLLFGDRYAAGAGALRALTVTAFLAAPAWLATVVVVRLAQVGDRLLAATVPIALGGLATYLLATRYGILGAAIGVDVLVGGYLMAHLGLVGPMVDLELRTLLASLVRTAAAAIAMAAVLNAVGTRDLSLGGWIIGAVGGAVAYLAVLLVTRELSVARARGR